MPNRGFLLRCTKPSEYDKHTSSVCKLSTEFVVGRGQDSSLFISHPTVSKVHCLFTYHDNGQHWTIEDKSLLGTWVNERRIPKEVSIPLSFADSVRFGPTHKFIYKFRSYLSVGGGSSSSDSSDDRMETSKEAGPSQARQGPSPLKRSLSDRSDPLRPTTNAISPYKRQRQSLSPEEIRQAHLKQIERLEKKQAFLENQLQFQLQDLHKKYEEEREAIVSEQKRLAAELDRIDASHVAEEQELRDKNVQKLTSVLQELAEIREQLSQEGSNKSQPSPSNLPSVNTPNNEPTGSSTAAPTSPLMELTQRLQGNHHTEVERALIQRLEESEREREALLRQLQAARGGANLEDTSARTRPGADLRHGCAPGRLALANV